MTHNDRPQKKNKSLQPNLPDDVKMSIEMSTKVSTSFIKTGFHFQPLTQQPRSQLKRNEEEISNGVTNHNPSYEILSDIPIKSYNDNKKMLHVTVSPFNSKQLLFIDFNTVNNNIMYDICLNKYFINSSMMNAPLQRYEGISDDRLKCVDFIYKDPQTNNICAIVLYERYENNTVRIVARLKIFDYNNGTWNTKHILPLSKRTRDIFEYNRECLTFIETINTSIYFR